MLGFALQRLDHPRILYFSLLPLLLSLLQLGSQPLILSDELHILLLCAY